MITTSNNSLSAPAVPKRFTFKAAAEGFAAFAPQLEAALNTALSDEEYQIRYALRPGDTVPEFKDGRPTTKLGSDAIRNAGAEVLEDIRSYYSALADVVMGQMGEAPSDEALRTLNGLAMTAHPLPDSVYSAHQRFGSNPIVHGAIVDMDAAHGLNLSLYNEVVAATDLLPVFMEQVENLLTRIYRPSDYLGVRHTMRVYNALVAALAEGRQADLTDLLNQAVTAEPIDPAELNRG